LDSEGITNVNGPKVYGAMMQGTRLFVRWKMTGEYEKEKTELLKRSSPSWAFRDNPLIHLNQSIGTAFPSRKVPDIKPETNRGKVFQYLKSIAPEEATNAQIRETTKVEPHQQVFMITQELMNKRMIRGRRIGKEWFFKYD
jgi:hypothetical protein